MKHHKASTLHLHTRRRGRRQRYRVRLLGGLAASLLLAVALVRLWPAPPPPERAPTSALYDNEAIQLEEVTQTTQAPRSAPPPPPPVPLYEAQNVIEQEPLDLSVDLAPDRSAEQAPPGPDSPRDGPDDENQATAPAVGARLLRTPEPAYTDAAREEGLRAQIDVEVVIAPTGRVEQARVLRRVLLDDAGNPQRTVASLGYGLEDAARDAAQRSLFRPARAGGEPVRSRKTLTLTFGL